MSISMAKYSMGLQAASSAHYEQHPTASTRVTAVDSASAALPVDLEVTVSDEGARKRQLRSFGGLVSPHLKAVQTQFLSAVQLAVQCTNSRQRLQALLPPAEEAVRLFKGGSEPHAVHTAEERMAAA
jgi:hypothetical protein